MSERLTVIVDGTPIIVAGGTTAVAAIAALKMTTRISVRGTPRGPFCGMGICQECQVRIDDKPYCLACQTLCRDGMRIDTDNYGAGK